jgi:hypothetical protein
MSVEQMVKIGKGGRERLMELVGLSRAQLEVCLKYIAPSSYCYSYAIYSYLMKYVAGKVQKRHDEEYEAYLHAPPPSRFTKIKNLLLGEWPWWWAIIGCIFLYFILYSY